MNRMTGTAMLDYRGETRQVHVCLNLDENVIEVRHAMPDLTRIKSLVAENDLLTSPVVLTDVWLSTPIGTISKDRLTDFFMTSYSPGSLSVYDATISQALTLHGKEEGVTKLVLHPRSSKVEFVFHSFDTLAPQFELFYRSANSSMPIPQELQLKSGRAVLMGDNRGLIIRGDQPLSNREEFIRLSLGILQGGHITVRSLLENNTLMINLSDHEGRSLGQLYKKHEEAGLLLQGIYDSLAELSPSDWARWSKGIYFFLQGLGGIAPLEIRAINFFTFLEIIDNSDTLDKNSLSALLGVTPDEADILCRTRNRLVHQGEGIGRAVSTAQKQISRHKKNPLDNTLFSIDHTDEQNTGISFFFRFARILNRLWIRRASFAGDWNDYSEYDPLN